MSLALLQKEHDKRCYLRLSPFLPFHHPQSRAPAGEGHDDRWLTASRGLRHGGWRGQAQWHRADQARPWLERCCGAEPRGGRGTVTRARGSHGEPSPAVSTQRGSWGRTGAAVAEEQAKATALLGLDGAAGSVTAWGIGGSGALHGVEGRQGAAARHGGRR